MPIEIAPGETVECEIHVAGRSPGNYSATYQVYIESKGVLFIEDVPVSLTYMEREMPEALKKELDEIRQATEEEMPASQEMDSQSEEKGAGESSNGLANSPSD